MSDTNPTPKETPSALALFERHDQEVAEFAARQGLNGVAVEELVAKSFARAHHHGVYARGPEGQLGWLHHLALQTHREICAALRGQYSSSSSQRRLSTYDPEAERVRRARQLAQRAQSELPDPLHDVFCLFELEGHGSAEVGRLLGLPVATVRERIIEARRQFLLIHYKLSLESESETPPVPPSGTAP